MRILVDCDGVLADFVGLVLDYIQRNIGLTPLREAIDQWDYFAAVGLREHWPHFRAQCDGLYLCRSMQVMPGARELWAAVERIDPHAMICTTPMTVSWLSQRAAWLEAEFGIPLTRQWHGHGKHDLTRSACRTAGFDVLIDDKVENCLDFRRAGGEAFCLAAAYNTHAVSEGLARGTHADCIEWLRARARK